MIYNLIIIGSQIQKYRKDKKNSLDTLGDNVGLSGIYIVNLESGGRTPNSSVSMINICTIAKILDISIDYSAESTIEYRKNILDTDEIMK